MTTALITHSLCLGHHPGPGHPESPLRLGAVLEALESEQFALLLRLASPPATRAQLLQVHSAGLIDDIFDGCPPEGCRNIDHDTVMSTGSLDAVLHAAGAACMAVDEVLSGQVRNAFCAVRPPGHHATFDQAMGFCLFNVIAVAAGHALAEYDLKRVAIVDFDVHHGNGTEDIFAQDPRVLYLSSHQWPLYPGTGVPGDRGIGNRVNIGLPEGCDSATFRNAWREIGFPALNEFSPELVMISAGFDAHRLDPLASLNLHTEDYRWITTELLDIARRHCDDRVVSVLEGGYSLTALRQCTEAHVAALMG